MMERITENLLRQQMELQSQQQRFLEQLVNQMSGQRMEQSEPRMLYVGTLDEDGGPSGGATPVARSGSSANGNQSQPGPKVSWLVTQIPEFSGEQDDNVSQWVRRVDKVAQIHGASDGVTLLAASSRLVKSAKKWYNIQTGAVIESWSNLKTELTKIFDRKLPFFRMMQKAEQRKWLPVKETFDQYAINKLTLIYQLNLSERDSTHLLISGINHHSLRASALTVADNPFEVFLEKMRTITEGVADLERKFSAATSVTKTNKEIMCRNCGKKGHETKTCKSEAICFYCKTSGHRR